MLLDNKNAIVTGASQGIGKAIASALLNEGARVAGWNRSKPSLTHDRFHSIPADVSDWASVQHAFGETLDILDGKIDILVNNSGIAYSGEFETLPIEKWQQMFRVNVDGIFYCSRLVIPVMKKQGRGHIVNISSIAGLNGVKNLAGYSATKHAVRGISHSLSWSFVNPASR